MVPKWTGMTAWRARKVCLGSLFCAVAWLSDSLPQLQGGNEQPLEGTQVSGTYLLLRNHFMLPQFKFCLLERFCKAVLWSQSKLFSEQVSFTNYHKPVSIIGSCSSEMLEDTELAELPLCNVCSIA